MNKEKKSILEKQSENIRFNQEVNEAYKKIHPFILEEEAESALSAVNKLIWLVFGILIVGIVIGSLKQFYN